MAKSQKTSLGGKGSSATMLDIAEKLNISVATVSRALRRVPGINADTRALVLQTASEVGYRLQESYRQEPLDKNQLLHVGVFIETTQSILFHPYLTGLSEAAMTLNSSLVIHHVNPGECERILDPAYQPRAMRSGLLSGIVLIFWWPTDVIKALSEKLPIVSIMHRYPGTGVDMVGLDSEGGMDTLVRELYNKGHRKIAFLGRCSKLQWSTARFGGYVTALASLDVEYRPQWVVDVDSETLSDKYAKWDSYGAAIDRIHKEGVTAWVCSTEPAGRMLHAWMTKKGVRIPQDVSITGFHRPTPSEPSMPDLTSVGASYEAIGSAALRRLHYRIQNPVEASRIVCFPCQFHAGSTIGRAAH
jgi:DNA-binding LacI/PurR family transcriptional regulator